MNSKIYYHCRDWPTPAGGIRRLYRHVEILASKGFKAVILHQKRGFRVNWFDSSAPVEYLDAGVSIRTCDVLVIPEGHTQLMRETKHASFKRVVIALNWARIFRSLTKGETWQSLNISGVIAGSSFESRFIKGTMGMDSTVIASGIDAAVFMPAIKEMTIAYMPAKDRFYHHLISSAFYCRYPEFSNIPFIEIDGRSHLEVASMLSSSSIFLAHTFPEGLSRKMLEAMACGCLVVGFAGGGSAECMEHLSNCYLVPDGDVLTAVDYLGRATNECLYGKSHVMRTNARETALRYSLDREERAVTEYWHQFLRSDS